VSSRRQLENSKITPKNIILFYKISKNFIIYNLLIMEKIFNKNVGEVSLKMGKNGTALHQVIWVIVSLSFL